MLNCIVVQFCSAIARIATSGFPLKVDGADQMFADTLKLTAQATLVVRLTW